MGAVNGLISGLIACSSAGNVNEDAVIEMIASRPLFGVADLYDAPLVDEVIRLVDLDQPEGYLPGFGD